jgi:glycosyltransferase involved in cell wall biosynthesis
MRSWPGHEEAEADVDERSEVTVVVPTRGRPDLVGACVEAVRDQDYAGQVTVIVVDDGGDLDAASVPPGIGNRAVRVLPNRRTPGPAGARNTGIIAGGGTFVAFCDDDDRWRQGKLAAQVDRLEKTAGLAGVSCGLALHFAAGRVRHRRAHKDQIEMADLLRTRPVHLHLSSMVCRRDLLLGRVGLFDEGVPGGYGEDYDWLLRLVAAGPISALPEPMVDVAWDGGSWFAERWDLIAEAITYLLAKHPEFRQQPRGLARLQGRLAFAHACAGDDASARSWAFRALRSDPLERRAYLALLLNAGAPIRGVIALSRLAGRGL